MTDQLLETQPLRDRFREAERLTRELIQHLELGFLPKTEDVKRVAKKGTAGTHAGELTDQTIRASVDGMLTAHEYTLDLTRKLERYLQSIEREVQSIVSGSQAIGQRPARR